MLALTVRVKHGICKRLSIERFWLRWFRWCRIFDVRLFFFWPLAAMDEFIDRLIYDTPPFVDGSFCPE
jgi:hypothetical protein